MLRYRFLAYAVLGLLLASCSSSKPMPPKTAQSSAVGVQVNLCHRLTITGCLKPSSVFFARMEDGENAKVAADRLLQANYIRGSNAYLLNAESGWYAAVAADAEVAISRGAAGASYTTNRYYFPAAAVQQSAAHVGADSFLALGILSLQARAIWENPDDVHMWYLKVLENRDEPPQFASQVGRSAMRQLGRQLGILGVLVADSGPDFSYQTSLSDNTPSGNTKVEFLRQAREDFVDSEWQAKIDKQLTTQPSR